MPNKYVIQQINKYAKAETDSSKKYKKLIATGYEKYFKNTSDNCFKENFEFKVSLTFDDKSDVNLVNSTATGEYYQSVRKFIKEEIPKIVEGIILAVLTSKLSKINFKKVKVKLK